MSQSDNPRDGLHGFYVAQVIGPKGMAFRVSGFDDKTGFARAASAEFATKAEAEDELRRATARS